MKAKAAALIATLVLSSANTAFAQLTQTISFDRSQAKVSAKNLGNAQFSEVEMDGLAGMGEPGEPRLPCKAIHMIIPPEQMIESMDITTGSGEVLSITKPVAPNPQHIRDISGAEIATQYNMDTRIYSSAQQWPKKAAQIISQGYFDGDKHLATIQVCPFAYEPKSNKLLFYSTVQVALRLRMMTSAEKYTQPALRPVGRQTIYDAVLRSMVQNKSDISRYSPARSSAGSGMQKASGRAATRPPFYEYVIITSPDLKSSFSTLINWKRQKGLDAGVVGTDQIYAYYTSGDITSGINDDAGKIRQYLLEAWQSGKTIWVLLGGYHDKVPVRFGTGDNNTYFYDGYDGPGKIPADLYFASLTDSWNQDGDAFYGEPEDNIDYSPEVFTARIPCSTPQDISNWTSILLKYEKSPAPDAITKVYQTQADQYQDYQSAQKMRDMLAGYGFSSTISEELPCATCPDPTSPTATDVLANMDGQYSMFFAYTHGFDRGFCFKTNAILPNDPYNAVPRSTILTFDFNPWTQAPVALPDATLRLSNSNYPKVWFTTSCGNSGFDVSESIASVFMHREAGGGPAFFGSSRYAYYDRSLDLTKMILKFLFDEGVVSLEESGITLSGNVADGVYITAGPKYVAHQSNVSYTALFDDADYSGTRATAWRWQMVLLHNGGEYVLNTQVNANLQNPCVWNFTVSPLPSTGFTWQRASDGAIRGLVRAETIDSDGYPHQSSMQVSYYEGQVPVQQGLAKTSSRALQVHSSQAGVCVLIGKRNYTAGRRHYMNLSHNLLGCPEMSIWTAAPQSFTSVSTSLNSSSPASLRINANVDGATIAVSSVQDGSGSYFQVARRVREYTFANITTADFPLQITITKENYFSFQMVQQSLSSPAGAAVTPVIVSATIPFTVSGTTAGKANSFDVQGGDGPDAAYNISLKKASVLDISLCGSGYDTKVEIFKADRTTTNYYNDDDLACLTMLHSGLHNVALAAGDYFIVVDGYDGQSGNYQMLVRYAPSGSLPIVELPFIHRGCTAGQTNKWDVQNGDGSDAEYSINFALPACIKLTTCNSFTNFNTMLEMFKSDRSRANIYNNDKSCTSGAGGVTSTISPARVVPGQYFVVVDGYGGVTGNYDLQIDYAYDYSITKFPYTHTGTTVGKKNDWDVMYSDADDVCYTFNLASPTVLDITLCRAGTNFDTKLEIFKENGVSTGFFNDDDYNCTLNGLRSSIKRAALAPGRYFLVVDGFAGQTGNYDLQVAVSAGLVKESEVSSMLSSAAVQQAFMHEATKQDLSIEGDVPRDMQPRFLVYELEKRMNGGKVVYPEGMESYAGLNDNVLANSRLPASLELVTGGVAQNQIRFGIPADGMVDISLYSLNGAKIRTVVRGWYEAGYHTAELSDGQAGLGKQVYICRIMTKGLALKQKILQVK